MDLAEVDRLVQEHNDLSRRLLLREHRIATVRPPSLLKASAKRKAVVMPRLRPPQIAPLRPRPPSTPPPTWLLPAPPRPRPPATPPPMWLRPGTLSRKQVQRRLAFLHARQQLVEWLATH